MEAEYANWGSFLKHVRSPRFALNAFLDHADADADDDGLDDAENSALDEALDEVDIPLTKLMSEQSKGRCSVCNIPYSVDGYCTECGEENECIEMTGISAVGEYGVSLYSATFKYVGPEASSYQKTLVKTCSVYGNMKEYNNKKDLMRCLYQNEHCIPKSIINNGLEYFNVASEHCIYRSKVRKGLFGACISYACIADKYSKSVESIAAIMNVDAKYVSKGEKVLQKLHDSNVITLPISTECKIRDDCIMKYMHLLKVPIKYKCFLVDFIKFVEKSSFKIKSANFKLNMQCIGAITFLSTRVRDLAHLTRALIEESCNIGTTSIGKYEAVIELLRVELKPVFKHYHIPMPLAWKNTFKPVRRKRALI